MKDITPEKKAAILIACAKKEVDGTGRLIDGARAQILRDFAPLSKTTLSRIRADYVAKQRGGDSGNPWYTLST